MTHKMEQFNYPPHGIFGRIYKLLILLLASWSLSLQAQSDTLTFAQYDSIFSSLDPSRIPHHILIDRAISVVKPSSFDGSPRTDTAI